MTGRRTIQLLRDSHAAPPGLDTALSRAILSEVSGGRRPETLRLHRPGPIVAFGPKDRLAPGFGAAVEAARANGFASIHRLAGGRAAVFHGDTIAFSWAIPDADPRPGITRRFDEVAALMAAVFRALGIDARVGEVPGEYCPGAHSVNARGATKLMGVGQRILARAAHVGGVVVVDGSERVRDVLVPVYAALGLAWRPETAGSLRDESSAVTWAGAEQAIVEAFAERYDVAEGALDRSTVAAARRLAPEHEAHAPAA